MSESNEYRNRMFLCIEAWQRSGLSKKVFCEQQGIPYHRLHYWHNCYRKQNSTCTDNLPSTPSSFLALEVYTNTGQAEIIYPDGKRLIFHQGVDVPFLKALLA